PRCEGMCDHNLLDILVIAVCAMICGADEWEDIADFGTCKEDWFRTFLELPCGIPSKYTFRRVFSLLDPAAFEACFTGWVKQTLTELSGCHHLAIDGKAIRGSKSQGKKAVHLVSAWSNQLGLVLGQERVDQKSNEITAIPKLLKALELKGCLITLDAMGCQTKVAEECVKQEADYVLAVKGNQKTLYNDIAALFEATEKQSQPGQFAESQTVGHGRKEHRCCWVMNDLGTLRTAHKWPGLKQVAVVQSDRQINGKVTTALRFYIMSKTLSALEVLNISRQHWAVENNLHWVLDVSFSEDACQAKAGNSAEN
ncbi:ISAs1 family transposase, partial [Parendozoicomonas sp. Alg238-R29]|uniref:ISAs1 family transposase n=1 Tax=Parendozoicomonas sp. Alg238-R29 TaxID=2993446 RepID=UPI00248E1A83